MNIKDVFIFTLTLAVIVGLHRLFDMHFDSAEKTNAVILAATNVILLAIRERAK